MPNKIHEVSQGGLTDGEPMVFAFGNPTQNTGWFYDAFRGKSRALWGTRSIDSREVAITNKAYLQELVDTHGLDSDLVKVRVRGMFPSQSARQFISVADVDAAFGRHIKPQQYDFAPKVLVCDPAWEGDDELVIALRQGLRFEILRVLAKNDNDFQVASIIAALEDEHKADAVFVDFGYGTGIVSAGRTLKRDWRLVNFGAAATDKGCLNMRSQMWKAMRDWLKAGGAIPPDDKLYADLIAPETVFRVDGKLQIESKRDMKARGLPSPDRADALALTFALPVQSKVRTAIDAILSKAQSQEYDPYADLTG